MYKLEILNKLEELRQNYFIFSEDRNFYSTYILDSEEYSFDQEDNFITIQNLARRTFVYIFYIFPKPNLNIKYYQIESDFTQLVKRKNIHRRELKLKND